MTSLDIRWDDNGVPHSVLFDDKYFCAHDGYAESFHVSCKGNDLPRRFASLDPDNAGTFTVIETGFGMGLSFCCAWELWDKAAPKSWKLRFISVELYPVSAAQIRKALFVWPQLAPYAAQLADAYVMPQQGITKITLDHGRVELVLVVAEVVEALKLIKKEGLAPNEADAWFLNGFSPFKNPQMWRPEVFEAMVPLSRSGTTLATFTVAAHVRRGLESCGFIVERVPGFGIKKNVLAGAMKF